MRKRTVLVLVDDGVAVLILDLVAPAVIDEDVDVHRSDLIKVVRSYLADSFIALSRKHRIAYQISEEKAYVAQIRQPRHRQHGCFEVHEIAAHPLRKLSFYVLAALLNIVFPLHDIVGLVGFIV